MYRLSYKRQKRLHLLNNKCFENQNFKCTRIQLCCNACTIQLTYHNPISLQQTKHVLKNALTYLRICVFTYLHHIYTTYIYNLCLWNQNWWMSYKEQKRLHLLNNRSVLKIKILNTHASSFAAMRLQYNITTEQPSLTATVWTTTQNTVWWQVSDTIHKSWQLSMTLQHNDDENDVWTPNRDYSELRASGVW